MSDKRERYQFQIDNRPAGPVRETWREAAQDAVNDGYAKWGREQLTVYLTDTQGAAIVKVAPAIETRTW